MTPKTNQSSRCRLIPIHTPLLLQHFLANATCVATNFDENFVTNETNNPSIAALLVGEKGLEPSQLALLVPKPHLMTILIIFF